jgi:hypothetical protein
MKIKLKLTSLANSSMSAHRLWLKQIAKLGLLMMMGVSMSACSKSWKEEVLLHDGSKIVIERVFNLALPIPENRERKELDETVTFALPVTNKKVVWKTDFNDIADDPYGLLGIQLLDIVNGTPYIAARPAGCMGFNKWARPNPPYVFFKYENDTWKRIALEEFPAELNRSNVILSSPATVLLKSFYTVVQVDAVNNDGIRAAGSKTIIRKPFPIEENRCPDLERIDGGWQTRGGPKLAYPITPPDTKPATTTQTKP